MELRKESKDIDLLSGPIWSKLLALALPMAAMAILQQLFNAADIAVVGSFVEDEAVAKAAMAAVGSNGPIVNLLVNLFVGISLGANVVIAQYIGQGNLKAVRKAVSTSIVVAFLGGIGIGLFGQFIVAKLIRLMGVPSDVFDLAVLYLRIYLVGMQVIFLYNFETAIFRSIGNTKTPLIVLFFCGMLNVILNLFFVLGLKMTVSGVATATVISNLVSAVVLLIALCRNGNMVQVDMHSLRIDPTILKQILRIGVPSGIQGMVFSVSNICVQSAINSLGTVVMAASSAALNLEYFTYYLITSFAQSCTTIVGQNYGAGQYDRCKRTLAVTFVFGILFFSIVVGIFLVFSHQILSIFNQDPEVISNAVTRLRIMCFAHVFSLIYEILAGYLRGFGISVIPALCTLTFVCGFRIVWIYFVFPIYPTLSTVMSIYPISLGITALVLSVVTFALRKQLIKDTQMMKLSEMKLRSEY